MADKPADVDPDEFAPDAAPTVIDEAVPFELMAEPNTDPHVLERSAEFLAGVEVGRAEGERDGYARGQEDAITELRKIREDVLETVHSLWVIFEIGFPDWETAERWIRSRLTPL